jgi:hypothetical protein
VGGEKRKVSILTGGGTASLPTWSAPPFQSSSQLAGGSAAPHRLHDLRVFPSGLNEPQSPSFRAKRGSATSPALEIGRS